MLVICVGRKGRRGREGGRRRKEKEGRGKKEEQGEVYQALPKEVGTGTCHGYPGIW